jgi:heterodisulfide reductase subunit A
MRAGRLTEEVERPMENKRILDFDALVVGGGIAGLQAALDLADQDFRVAVIEKDASIGGKMIRLSKVFPTLDCASCITTPKMAAAAHHENITILTDCDLQSLKRQDGELVATVTQRPRYVDLDKCIGCRQCEYGCPVYVPDEEQGGFTMRKAIHIPFSNAIPRLRPWMWPTAPCAANAPRSAPPTRWITSSNRKT